MGTGFNELYAVDAYSSSNVWASGTFRNNQSGPDHALLERWNGSKWTVVPSVSTLNETDLKGVAVASKSSVFAVGSASNNSTGKAVIEHWTRGGGVVLMKNPQPGDTWTELNAVTAVSPKNVWAVGDYDSSGVWKTLILHWNGRKWTKFTSPSPSSTSNVLNSVSAISSGDVWAVGVTAALGGGLQTLTLHFDGSSWSQFASSNVPSKDNRLLAVAGSSTGDVWAVGYAGTAGAPDTLTLHWNGSLWSIVASQNPGSSANYLEGLAVVSSGNVYAVGNQYSPYQTLIEKWNGASWQVVSSPSPGGSYNLLSGATALTTGQVWAVGDEGDPFHSLVLRACV